MKAIKLVRISELAQILSVSRSTIYRWLQEKSEFPKPVQLSKRIIAWKMEEIDEWLSKKRK